MKAKCIPQMMAIGFILTTGSTFARDVAPPKSETEQLRDRVTQLEERIKGLEALLTAKEILPPSKVERPELWTTLKITMDNTGIIRLGDTIIDADGLKQSIQKVFKDEKF